jgi:peptide/nickel transport system substrate-binding protein
MPERLAKIDGNTQITEMVGSGPYRFLKDEFVAGSRVAYAKFDGYVPRDEPASWAAGGKRAYMQRVEWQIIPDSATAAAALQSGEIDWWEIALPDLIPQMQKNPLVTVVNADPFGFISILRFNCSQPPFNNVKLRKAVMSAIDQNDYMAAISGGDASAYSTCFSSFACGLPHVKEIGAELMKPPRNLDAARAAVKASGYNGEKAVVINPTDFANIGPHGELTADLLKKLGINVELQETDWGTVVQRRTSREPVEKGGWSIFTTWGPGLATGNPIFSPWARGQGATGWFGWFEDAGTEALVQEWLYAADDDRRRKLASTINSRVLEGVGTIPLGQGPVQTALRADLTGMVEANNPFPWNLRRA